jgi:hypothetical protein
MKIFCYLRTKLTGWVIVFISLSIVLSAMPEAKRNATPLWNQDQYQKSLSTYVAIWCNIGPAWFSFVSSSIVWLLLRETLACLFGLPRQARASIEDAAGRSVLPNNDQTDAVSLICPGHNAQIESFNEIFFKTRRLVPAACLRVSVELSFHEKTSGPKSMSISIYHK